MKTSESPSSTIMSSLKLVLISTSVLSAAIMLRLSAPAIADFAECVPSIYNGVVSWLRPPYLYLVINFIIFTIVASSKLQSRKEEDGVSASLSPATQPQTVMPPVKSIQTDFPTAEYNYSGVVFADPSGYVVEAVKESELGIDTCDELVDENIEDSPVIIGRDGGAYAADATSNKENEYVIPKSTWNFVPEKRDLTENYPSSVKPPVSARFSHRRNVKASPEGVRTVLGVSRPKKQDTLESTWRTITEGRAMPITRHLKKSDTWERDNHHGSLQREKTPPQKSMKKAETFNDRTNTRSPSPCSSDGGGSEKLRRDASLGQDELNRRVEAFIKKFNEEMRMQRQESLNQYKEMVN